MALVSLPRLLLSNGISGATKLIQMPFGMFLDYFHFYNMFHSLSEFTSPTLMKTLIFMVLATRLQGTQLHYGMLGAVSTRRGISPKVRFSFEMWEASGLAGIFSVINPAKLLTVVHFCMKQAHLDVSAILFS